MDEGILFECTKSPDFSLLELLSPPCLEPPSPPCLEPPSPPCLEPPSPPCSLTLSSCPNPAGSRGGGTGLESCERFPSDLLHTEPEPGAFCEGPESSYQVPEFTILCLLREAAKLEPALPLLRNSTFQSSPGVAEERSQNRDCTHSTFSSHPVSPSGGARSPRVREQRQLPQTVSSTGHSVWRGQNCSSEEGSHTERQLLHYSSEGQGDSLLIDGECSNDSVPGPALDAGARSIGAGGGHQWSPSERVGPGQGEGKAEGSFGTGWACAQCPSNFAQGEVGTMSWGCARESRAEVEGKEGWARDPGGIAGICSQAANEEQGNKLAVKGKGQGETELCPAQATAPLASVLGPESKTSCVSQKSDSSTPAQNRTRTPRKQATPQRSAEHGDPTFEGVTVRMERHIVSDYDCQLRITARYSPGLRQKLMRMRAHRNRPEPLGSRFSSSEEDSPNTVQGKSCASCGTVKTPLWRDAEDGTPLCNACGIRYKKYRIRCSNCWHIPKKEGKSFVRCLRCGDALRLHLSDRKLSIR